MSDLDDVTVNAIELGEFVEVGERAVQLYAKDGMPRDGHGRYPLKACVRWICARLRQSSTAMNDARSRKAQADAGLRELELAAKSGAMVNTDEAVADVESDYDQVTALLNTLPTRIAGRLNMPELRPTIAAEIQEVLGVLSTADDLRSATEAARRVAASAGARVPAQGAAEPGGVGGQ